MSTAFGDLSLAEDDNLVGINYSRKPVCDDQRRPVPRNKLQRRLYLALGPRIEGGRRLVE